MLRALRKTLLGPLGRNALPKRAGASLSEGAYLRLADATLGERKLYVGRAQKKFEREEELRRQFEALKLEQMAKYHGVNLYVKNLDEGVSEEVLRAEFAPYGSLTSVKIMADERGVSRGFGFVCFSAPEEAARAIAETNGRMLAGKPLYVALAQRRDERRAQLESQFAQRAQQMRMQAMAAAAAGLSSVPLVGMGIYQQGPLFYPGPGGARFGRVQHAVVIAVGSFQQARHAALGPRLPGGRGGEVAGVEAAAVVSIQGLEAGGGRGQELSLADAAVAIGVDPRRRQGLGGADGAECGGQADGQQDGAEHGTSEGSAAWR